MAVSLQVSGLGFAKLNTATMPCQTISFSPNLGVEPFRSGGDLAPSMMRRAGARPVFRFTAPLDSVYAALASLLPVTLTAFEMHVAAFTAGVRQSTGTQYKLDTTNGDAIALITGISAAGGPVPLAMAEVTIFLTSKQGLIDPVTTSTGALPTLGSTPNLHVLSTLVDNLTAKWGVNEWRIDIGCTMDPIQTDGLFYPTGYRMGAIGASATMTHTDVTAMYTMLTGDGYDATGAGLILYARAYNMTTKVLTTTGYSFTFTNAFAELTDITATGNEKATLALRLSAYAAPGTLTHPVSVATSATVPT